MLHGYAKGLLSTTSMLIIASGVSLGASAGHVSANERSNEFLLDEIVVTATRRGEQSIQTIPLAITAVSGRDLSRAGVSSLQDLRKIEPALNIASFGAGQQRTVIRGIQSQNGATTGLYFDESPIVGGTGSPTNILGDGKPGLHLHDIDHVEVLKGPQGTLFGSGSVSGTLRVITAKPDLAEFGGHFEGSVAVVDGGNELYKGSVTLNAPVVEGIFGVRAVVWGETGGGFIDQSINGVASKNVNDGHVKGVRLTALLQASEDMRITLSGTHQDIDIDGAQAWQLPLGAYRTNSPSVEFYEDEFNLINATVEYDTGVGSIVASGSYGEQSVLAPKDSTPTAQLFGLPGTIYVPTIDFKYYTGELRFSSNFDGPLQLVAGAYYEYGKNDFGTNAVANNAEGTSLCYVYDECNEKGLRNPGSGNSLYQFGTLTRENTEQYAAYAQIDYRVIPDLTATVGARYYEAKIHRVVTNRQTIFPDFIFGIVSPLTVTSDQRGKHTKPSYNFSLLWESTPDVSMYVRAASGFRLGGVNSSTSLAGQAGIVFPATYEPDSLWNYELGIKGSLFENRLSFDLSVYHIDWKGQQLVAQTAGGAFTYTVNAGKTVTDGVELNTKLLLSEGLTIGAGLTYVDAKLDTDLPQAVIAAGTVGLKGDSLPVTPKFSANISVEYEAPVSSSLDGFVRAGLNYHGGSYSSFSSASTFYTRLPSYILVDARVGVRSDVWGVNLFAENLTNEKAFFGVYDSIDGIRIFSPRPRVIGLQVSANF